jgi:hypothetical protein
MASPNLITPSGENSFCAEARRQTLPLQSRLLHSAIKALRHIGRSQPYPRLDLDAMSDYMKRDLGFLDWSRPYHEHDAIQ